MSDEQERPLTRRELRAREGWGSQDADAAPEGIDVAALEFEQSLTVEVQPPTTTSSIPVVGPDGRLLSRRELRELWAAEEAAAQAANTTNVDAPAVPDEAIAAEANQLVDIESDAAAPVEPEEVELDVAADFDGDVVDEVATEHDPLPAPQHKGFRFPWSKKRDSAPEEDADAHPVDSDGALAAGAGVAVASSVISDIESESEDDPVGERAPGSEVEAESERDSNVEPEASPEVVAVDQPEPEPEPEAGPVEPEAPEAAADASVKPVVTEYSFPEVSPDPESRSIFDQHTTGTIGFVPTTEITDPSETGAFDDIITRAVADEGAASPTNTAALILPTLPDTTDLSGALNETGEIVITGSIELPKTLGETGGHIELHDTLDPHEAVVLGHDVHDVVLEAENHTQPVSASRAVSAQASNNAIVSPVSQGDSKLPLILAVSAGGLIVVVAAVFIWAASTGLFG